MLCNIYNISVAISILVCGCCIKLVVLTLKLYQTPLPLQQPVDQLDLEMIGHQDSTQIYISPVLTCRRVTKIR